MNLDKQVFCGEFHEYLERDLDKELNSDLINVLHIEDELFGILAADLLDELNREIYWELDRELRISLQSDHETQISLRNEN